MPFKRYFKVSAVQEYHRAIPLEDFMSSPLAESVWPPEKRVSLCYSMRHGSDKDSCNAKEGNPFGPFWDTFGIDFAHSATYG